MFEGVVPFPFLVSRLRDHFWLDGYEMLAVRQSRVVAYTGLTTLS